MAKASMVSRETMEKAKAFRLRPLDDRVVVLPDEPLDRTEGGILLPDTAKERPMTGTVVAVGPGRQDKDGFTVPMSIEPDHRAWYSRYAGNPVEVDGITYLVMREGDVLLVE